MKNCSKCIYAIMRDHGYSNYTVEGTTFICSKALHPEGSFDRFFGENPRLDFADQCSGYEEGEPVELDVDGEWRDSQEIMTHPAIKIMVVRGTLLNQDLLENI